jgi:uncharacterized membrane protein YbhN (UPF0104 family)
MDRAGRRTRWSRLRPWLKLAFFLLVAAAIGYAARSIQWPLVADSLRRIPPQRLALAAALSALSYAGYACTDLFALPYMEGRLRPRQSMRIAFISYAFNQNFGSLLGTIGFRFRLYSHHGLQPSSITRIVGLSFITNWCGYFLLGGVAFASGWLRLPPRWQLGSAGLQCLGAGLLCILCAYFWTCLRARRRQWQWFGITLQVPSWRRALLQLALSLEIWLSVATAMDVLLPGRPPFLTVLAVFLLASVAGLITHVPGGLGVIEAVFLSLLGSRSSRHELLAALLAYRAVYYLAPLALALVLYVWLEMRSPRRERRPHPHRAARNPS